MTKRLTLTDRVYNSIEDHGPITSREIQRKLRTATPDQVKNTLKHLSRRGEIRFARGSGWTS